MSDLFRAVTLAASITLLVVLASMRNPNSN